MSEKFAIIDLGSNSVRTIIMKIYNNGSYKMVDQAKEMVRLSENMGPEMTLKPKPIKRTLYTLKLFKKIIDAHKVDKVLCVATAAVRSAKNKDFFIKKVKEETGFEVNVISGEQEAYYDYLGVINTIDINDCILIDIGGASTEIAWIKNRKLKKAISLPYGAVLLTEQFLKEDFKSIERIRKLEEFICGEIEKIRWLKKLKRIPVVGLGGTIRTIAKIDKKKIKFPFQSLHNYQITKDEVLYAYNKVSSKKVKKIKKIKGVKKTRADIITAGLAPIKCLMDCVKTKKLIISGNGLREGIFFENYFKTLNKETKIVDDVLKSSIYNNLRIYDVNVKHAEHVKNLALSLFDQTEKLHGFGKKERKLLEVGAMFHDVGKYVDYYNHHRHGFYLTLNSRIYGLRNRELTICAFLVGRHRDTSLKESWKKYKMLIDKNDYKMIKKLSLFLKIAEMLDRGEYEIIEGVDCEVLSDCVIMKVKSIGDADLEIYNVNKFKKDFKKRLKRELCIEPG